MAIRSVQSKTILHPHFIYGRRGRESGWKRKYLEVGRPWQSSLLHESAPLWSQLYVSTAATIPAYSFMWTGVVVDFNKGRRPWMPIATALLWVRVCFSQSIRKNLQMVLWRKESKKKNIRERPWYRVLFRCVSSNSLFFLFVYPLLTHWSFPALCFRSLLCSTAFTLCVRTNGVWNLNVRYFHLSFESSPESSLW